MLQSIRDKAQGWIAWAIILLISVPFALWGIGEYFGGGAEPVVAKVNGEEITDYDLNQRARSARENLRLQLGESYRPEFFPEQTLRRQVLEQIINEHVLFQAASDLGMRVSDESVIRYIQSQRAFQVDGRFDVVTYENALRNRGLSKAAFEQIVRQDLLLRQFNDAVRTSAFAVDYEVTEAARVEYQTRDLSYAIIPASRFIDDVVVDDAALEAYYKAHEAAYMQPERVKLDYVVLDVDTLAKGIEFTEQELRDYFEQHRGEFTVPRQRKLRYILISLKEGEAKALAEAQKLRERILAGEDFAQLAKEYSQDPASAAKGGELGWIEPGMMVKSFDEVAFSLAKGEVSEPVKTPFGYQLIQVEDIRGESEPSFEQLRDKVAEAYRRFEAEQRFYDYAERLANLSYEQPDSLEPAANDLGLSVQHSDWMTRQGGEDILASPKVVAAAFSDDVLKDGRNSEVIELGPEKLLVLRVQAHEEAQQKPLEAVREKVVEAYKQAKARELAASAAESLMQKLRSGADLAQTIASAGWSLDTVDGVKRDNQALPQAVLEKAFSLPRPQADKPIIAGTAMPSGDYAVIALRAVHDGKLADDTAKRLLTNQLTSAHGSAEYQAFLKKLREEADIELLE